MMPIADGGLRHLRNQGLRVEQQQLLQRAALFEFMFDYLRANPIRVTAALYDRLVWRGVPAQEQGDAEQAFVSCHRDLCRRAIRHDVDKRNDAGCGEIKVPQLATRGVHDLDEWHRNKLKIWQQSFVDCLRQGRQQMILQGSRELWHCELPA